MVSLGKVLNMEGRIFHNEAKTKRKELIIICPTRGRPQKAREMWVSYINTKTYPSTIVFYVADDDPCYDQYMTTLKSCPFITGPRLTIIEVMNLVSGLFPEVKYFSCVGDDNRYKTIAWDSMLVNEIESKGLGWGIAYGRDNLQDRALPGNPVISANIVKIMGSMAPPCFIHQYVDNSWGELGLEIGRLLYREDVLIEHLHPFNKKAEMDDNYRHIYESDIGPKDAAAFKQWKATTLPGKARTILKAMCADVRKLPGYKSISLCMIVADSEKPEVLVRCLKSIAFYVDEVNIVINYKRWKSIKKICNLQEAIGNALEQATYLDNKCYTTYEKWTNFSDMRNRSLDMATKELCMWLDADDVVPIPQAIPVAIIRNPKADAYKFRVFSLTPFGTTEQILHTRIFKNKAEYRFQNLVHEDISLALLEHKAVTVMTNIPIKHLGNVSYKDFKRKNLRNLALLNKQYDQGDPQPLIVYALINSLMIVSGKKNFQRCVDLTLMAFKKFDWNEGDPLYSKMYVLQGLAYIGVGYYSLARKSFLVAWDKFKHPQAAINLAFLYKKTKEYDKAIELLEELRKIETFEVGNIPIDVDDIERLLYRHLGDCYFLTDNKEKAELNYVELLKLDPNDLEAADRCIQIFAVTKRFDKMVEATIQYINRYPTYFVGWGRMGEYELMNKRYQTALLFFEKALRINSRYDVAHQNVIQIKRYLSGRKV